MRLPAINVCPSTLRPGFTTYSPMAAANLFGSRARKISHILPFGPPGKNAILTREYNEKRKHISISGVQEKYSLRQEKNSLILTDRGGTHILKPIPNERLERLKDLPANEHLSMQIAKQVFNINTAACGMIFFEDGSPAYLTKRFDYKPDGTGNYQLEDFATLMGKSPEREGLNFKYNASYLDIANLIKQYTVAVPVVLMEFFQLLIVNYLIANGDAHLKNFSLMETQQGDYILSPAYDLLCTKLHLDDNHLGLHNGLYEGDYDEATYYDVGMYTGESFIVFARKAGIPEAIARQIIDKIVRKIPDAQALVQRSFLSKEAKGKYMEILTQRKRLLMYDPETKTLGR
ncbi:HipA domain-containing protein [Chitinophaga arvensicola]|uniref:Serine/threonine-protein kinase HipA n=1 Tax=Chitinophaga arvensicola TaxID=29529 RepID=A0A1I0PK51_9BACT|nr:HipA domain-containing protein [Chitinophaga arvensicola]SEW14729.1 serine/threonine-protein kinase HipA [Chitinophaga arvensicola]